MGRASRQLKLAGVFAASVTPDRPGTLDIDYPALLDLIDFLAEGGVAGICLMGSTGEFLKFSLSDRQRMIYLAAKRSRVPLMVGVGHPTLTGAVQLGGEAISAGADALLLMPPVFFPYGQPEIEAFYREFAREMGDAVPILIYNIPQFTSRIEIDTIGRLLDTGSFAGIKDSSGDWPRFAQLLAMKRDRTFAVFAGNDRIALRALQEGADGVVSGCACALPELVAGLYRAFTSGNQTEANRLNDLLAQFCGWVERFPTPVAIKRAVELRGYKAGEYSVPLAEETARELERFSAWFKDFNAGTAQNRR
jgi:4-hydroxy-tetrahydrodipicolinate synthase